MSILPNGPSPVIWKPTFHRRRKGRRGYIFCLAPRYRQTKTTPDEQSAFLGAFSSLGNTLGLFPQGWGFGYNRRLPIGSEINLTPRSLCPCGEIILSFV
jgi:hypothetical protein